MLRLVAALGAIAVMGGASCSRPPAVPAREVPAAALTLRPELGRWFHQGKPYDGYAVKRGASGAVLERIGYLDGKKQGVARSFYPDGSLRRRASYHRNRLHGVVEFFGATGTLVSLARYDFGVLHGEQRSWYPDGSPYKQRTLAYGREEGLQRAWRRNGKLYVNYEARHGRIYGLRRPTLCFQLEDGDVTYQNDLRAGAPGGLRSR